MKKVQVMSWGVLFIIAIALCLFLIGFTQSVDLHKDKILPLDGYILSAGTIVGYEGDDKVLEIPASYSYGGTKQKVGQITFNYEWEAFDFLEENYAIGAEGYYDFYEQIYTHEYPWDYTYNITQYIYVQGDDFKITNIAESAFRNNRKIEKVILPRAIEKIGNFAFQICTNLKEIQFSEGLKVIGDSTFWGTAIETIKFPKSLETIYPYAFYNCKKLREVTVGENVEEIMMGCFNGCENLEYVYLNSQYAIDTFYTDYYQVFSRCPKLKAIYVPEKHLNYYQTTMPWSMWSELYQPI